MSIDCHPSTNNTCRLKYQPFSSVINPGFWQQLTNIKLNKLKLSQDPVKANGTYSSRSGTENVPCLASFDYYSFNSELESLPQNSKNTFPLYGKVVCFNIIQEFFDFNKKKLLDNSGAEVWNSILNGSAINEPEKCLSKFTLLVYADLKKYKFFYWFSFPSLNYPKDVYYEEVDSTRSDKQEPAKSSKRILDVFSEKALATLQSEFDSPDDLRSFNRSYFIVKHTYQANQGDDSVQVYPLSQYFDIVKNCSTQDKSELYFAYSDTTSNLTHPGWPLRNYLCLIATQFQLSRVKILRIRVGPPSDESKYELHHSLIMSVYYELDPKYNSVSTIKPEPTMRQLEMYELPLVTGWEKNENQQMAPKRVCLASLLDPKKLAEDALNLNLRLMKWRLIPSLDLEKINSTKCLLLGAGTLGCHIARGLLAWGIKKISFVDNSRISFSNPVRQTLYNFEDCIGPSSSTSKFKAPAALEALKRIYPQVEGEAHVLSIPMPGHFIPDIEIEQTRKDISKLQDLIESHDAIFLLMDTRESRWLPTVIGMSKQKLIINAAIGFDTFLVQRYGIRNYSNLNDEQVLPSSSSFATVASAVKAEMCASALANIVSSNGDKRAPSISSDMLGCYFCNDIVAPGDSTQDRTLDQQCTVSRPGVSMMVSALAVELLVSVLTSKEGPLTPAPIQPQEEDYDASDLGLVPHTIRGNMSRFEIYMPTSLAFVKCAGCSLSVINAYKLSGTQFLERVFDDPNYLEELAGLKDIQVIDEGSVWAIDDDESLQDD